jgi:hypothetical protein
MQLPGKLFTGSGGAGSKKPGSCPVFYCQSAAAELRPHPAKMYGFFQESYGQDVPHHPGVLL